MTLISKYHKGIWGKFSHLAWLNPLSREGELESLEIYIPSKEWGKCSPGNRINMYNLLTTKLDELQNTKCSCSKLTNWGKINKVATTKLVSTQWSSLPMGFLGVDWEYQGNTLKLFPEQGEVVSAMVILLRWPCRETPSALYWCQHCGVHKAS